MSDRNGYVTYNGAAFEGSGAGGGFYDDIKDRRERRQGMTFMIVLLGLVLVCIVVTSLLLAKDINYKVNGTKQVAHYSENNHGASFEAPDGSFYVVDAYWSFPSGDTVNVYYLNQEYKKAIALYHPAIWFVCYGVFGGIFAFAIYIGVRSVHPKKHAVPKRSESEI